MTAALTLGPIAYHWPAETRRDFYARIADEAPVDTVYLGEVICSKRAPFFEPDLPDLVERLQRAGKTVVLSSLAEVMLPRERQATRALCEMDGIEIEINNAAGLQARAGAPHRVGPFMNAYNEAAIDWLAQNGATHVCLPHELPRASLAYAAAAASQICVGTEFQVFGRAPLAVSARCYHARAHGRHKDNCQFVCEDDPDGMPLLTADNTPFLRVNGIQTQSESYICLAREIPDLVAIGIGHLRLMPQSIDMVAVATAFRQCLDGVIDGEEAMSRLSLCCGATALSNGFFHRVAGRMLVTGRIAASADGR